MGTNKSILKKIFTMEPNFTQKQLKNPKYNKTTSNITPKRRSPQIKTQAKSKFIKFFTHLSTIKSGSKFLMSSSDSGSLNSNCSVKAKGKVKRQPSLKKPILAPHYRPPFLGIPPKLKFPTRQELKFPTRRLGTNMSVRSGIGEDSDDEKISRQLMSHSKLASPIFDARKGDSSKDPSILNKKIVEKKGTEVGL
jgi:hypothetical protein